MTRFSFSRYDSNDNEKDRLRHIVIVGREVTSGLLVQSR